MPKCMGLGFTVGVLFVCPRLGPRLGRPRLGQHRPPWSANLILMLDNFGQGSRHFS
jgi:hypothetical protein